MENLPSWFNSLKSIIIISNDGVSIGLIRQLYQYLKNKDIDVEMRNEIHGEYTLKEYINQELIINFKEIDDIIDEIPQLD